MRQAIHQVDRHTFYPFPFDSMLKVGSLIVDGDGRVIASAVNGMGQQHAERLAILDAYEKVLKAKQKGGELREDAETIAQGIAYLRLAWKVNPFFEETHLEMVDWLRTRLGNPFASMTLVLTVAPCNHCERLIARAGFKHVMYGHSMNKTFRTPPSRVLERAGISVTGGILKNEIQRRNRITLLFASHVPAFYNRVKNSQRFFYSRYAAWRYQSEWKTQSLAVQTIFASIRSPRSEVREEGAHQGKGTWRGILYKAKPWIQVIGWAGLLANMGFAFWHASYLIWPAAPHWAPYWPVMAEGAAIAAFFIWLCKFKENPVKQFAALLTGLPVIFAAFHLVLPVFFSMYQASSNRSISELFSFIVTRFALIWPGIFASKFLRFRILARAGAAPTEPFSWKKELWKSFKWAVIGGLVGGYYFCFVFYNFMSVNVPQANYIPSWGPVLSTLFVKCAFDLGIATVFVHNPFHFVTGAAFSEEVRIFEKRPDFWSNLFRHLKAQYVTVAPLSFLYWYLGVFLLWTFFPTLTYGLVLAHTMMTTVWTLIYEAIIQSWKIEANKATPPSDSSAAPTQVEPQPASITDPILLRTQPPRYFTWQRWKVSKGGWPYVANPNIAQGWKLHIAFTEENAAEVLDLVLPILWKHQVPHKVVGGLEMLSKLNHLTGANQTQRGKCIAVYAAELNAEDLQNPEAIEAARFKTRQLGSEIDNALKGRGFQPPEGLLWNGEGDAGDKLIRHGESGLVAYRFGSFTGDVLADAQGRWVADERDRYKPSQGFTQVTLAFPNTAHGNEAENSEANFSPRFDAKESIFELPIASEGSRQFYYRHYSSGWTELRIYKPESEEESVVSAGKEEFIREITDTPDGPYILFRVGESLILKRNGTVIGFLYFWLKLSPDQWRPLQYYRLYNLPGDALLGGFFISPEFSRHGLAVTLLDEYFKLVEQLGLKDVGYAYDVKLPERIFLLDQYGFDPDIHNELFLKAFDGRSVGSETAPVKVVLARRENNLGLYFPISEEQEKFRTWLKMTGRPDPYMYLDQAPADGRTLYLNAHYKLNYLRRARSEVRGGEPLVIPPEKDFLAGSVDGTGSKHKTVFYRFRDEGFTPVDAMMFDYFIDLMAERAKRNGQVRVLSAASSLGAEAYTIIFELLERGLTPEQIEVVGVDFSEKAVRIAREGTYVRDSGVPAINSWSWALSRKQHDSFFRHIPRSVLRKYFTIRDGRVFKIDDRVKTQMQFEVMNLLDRESLLSLGQFDGVTASAFLYQHSYPDRQQILENLAGVTKPDGFLLLKMGGTFSQHAELHVRSDTSATHFRRAPTPERIRETAAESRYEQDTEPRFFSESPSQIFDSARSEVRKVTREHTLVVRLGTPTPGVNNDQVRSEMRWVGLSGLGWKDIQENAGQLASGDPVARIKNFYTKYAAIFGNIYHHTLGDLAGAFNLARLKLDVQGIRLAVKRYFHDLGPFLTIVSRYQNDFHSFDSVNDHQDLIMEPFLGQMPFAVASFDMIGVGYGFFDLLHRQFSLAESFAYMSSIFINHKKYDISGKRKVNLKPQFRSEVREADRRAFRRAEVRSKTMRVNEFYVPPFEQLVKYYSTFSPSGYSGAGSQMKVLSMVSTNLFARDWLIKKIASLGTHLDILSPGSGGGHLENRLIWEGGHTVLGLDHNKELRRQALRRDVPTRLGDAHKLGRMHFQKQFDVILFNESIAHMDPFRVFKGAVKHLKPGGRMVVTLRDPGRQTLRREFEINGVYYHSVETIKKAFRAAGLKVEGHDVVTRTMRSGPFSFTQYFFDCFIATTITGRRPEREVGSSNTRSEMHLAPVGPSTFQSATKERRRSEMRGGMFVPPGIDPEKKIGAVVVLSDFDGVLRFAGDSPSMDSTLDTPLKGLLTHPKSRFLILSGSPAVPDTERAAWFSDHPPIGPAVIRADNPLASVVSRLKIIGAQGGHAFDIVTGKSQYLLPLFEGEEAFEIARSILRVFIEEVLPKQASEWVAPQVIAEARRLLGEAIYTADTSGDFKAPLQAFEPVVMWIREHVNAQARLMHRGTEIEFQVRTPKLNLNLAASTLAARIKPQVFSGRYFLKATRSSKGEAGVRYLEEVLPELRAGLAPDEQVLIVAFGDDRVDFPMYRLADVAFHMGRAEDIDPKELPNVIVTRNPQGQDTQQTRGTREVIGNLNQTIGQPFANYRYQQFPDASGVWRWYSLNDLSSARSALTPSAPVLLRQDLGSPVRSEMHLAPVGPSTFRSATTESRRSEMRQVKAPEAIEPISGRKLSHDKPFLAVFDVHGTLLEAMWKIPYLLAYQELTGANAETAKIWVEKNAHKDLTRLLIEITEEPAKKVKVIIAKHREKMHRISQPKAIEGAVALIKALRNKGVPVVIMSASPRSLIIPQLVKAGLRDLVPDEMIVSVDEMVLSKEKGKYSVRDRENALRSIQRHFPHHTLLHFNDMAEGFKLGAEELGGYSFGLPQGNKEDREMQSNRRMLTRGDVDFIVPEGVRAWRKILKFLDIREDLQKKDWVVPVALKPAEEVSLILPAHREPGLKLHIDVHSDPENPDHDFETLTYSQVVDDTAVNRRDGSVDYGELRIKELKTFPSSFLMSPMAWLEAHLSKTLYAKIYRLWKQNKRYTTYRGVTVSWDGAADKDVWTTNIDTVFMQLGIEEFELIKKLLKYSNALRIHELGVGGGQIITSIAMLMKKLGAKLKELSFSDISLYALRTAKRVVMPFLGQGVRVRTFLGQGLGNLSRMLDALLVNPPYIPTLPNDPAAHTDPYRGTGLIREVMEHGIDYLNPNNPEASIIINLSSLAAKDFAHYRELYEKDRLLIEPIGKPRKVPLKIQAITDEWKDWLVSQGLLEKKENPAPGEEKYWHTLQLYRIRSKAVVDAFRQAEAQHPSATKESRRSEMRFKTKVIEGFVAEEPETLDTGFVANLKTGSREAANRTVILNLGHLIRAKPINPGPPQDWILSKEENLFSAVLNLCTLLVAYVPETRHIYVVHSKYEDASEAQDFWSGKIMPAIQKKSALVFLAGGTRFQGVLSDKAQAFREQVLRDVMSMPDVTLVRAVPSQGDKQITAFFDPDQTQAAAFISDASIGYGSELRGESSSRLLILQGLTGEARRRSLQQAFRERRAAGLTPEQIQLAQYLLKQFGVIDSSRLAPLLEREGVNQFFSDFLRRPVRILFKDETVNPTGSFKDRSPILLYDRIERAVQLGEALPEELDVISTGNHAAANAEGRKRAAAYYVKQTGKPLPLKVKVFMGMDAKPHKIARVRELGADVILEDASKRPIPSYMDAETIVEPRINGTSIIQTRHADSFVSAGYAVSGLEIFQQVRNQGALSSPTGEGMALISPVGSGGFFSGLMEILDLLPDLRAYGVSAAPADLTYRTVEKRLHHEPHATMVRRAVGEMHSDGIAATPEPYAVKMIEKTADGLLLVPDKTTIPVLGLLEDAEIHVEPTSALPLVAIMAHPDLFSSIHTFIIPLTSKNRSQETENEVRKWRGRRNAVRDYYQEKFARSEVRGARVLSSKDFNEFGVALTEKGKAKAIARYQKAWELFSKGTRLMPELEVQGIVGSLLQGNGRLGIYPSGILFDDLKNTLRRKDSKEVRRTPSDLDVLIRWNKEPIHIVRDVIAPKVISYSYTHPPLTALIRDIFEKTGVYLHVDHRFYRESLFSLNDLHQKALEERLAEKYFSAGFKPSIGIAGFWSASSDFLFSAFRFLTPSASSENQASASAFQNAIRSLLLSRSETRSDSEKPKAEQLKISEKRRVTLPKNFEFKPGDQVVFLAAITRNPPEVLVMSEKTVLEGVAEMEKRFPPEMRGIYKKIYGSHAMNATVAQDGSIFLSDHFYQLIQPYLETLVWKKNHRFFREETPEHPEDAQPPADHSRSEVREQKASNLVETIRTASRLEQREMAQGDLMTLADQILLRSSMDEGEWKVSAEEWEKQQRWLAGHFMDALVASYDAEDASLLAEVQQLRKVPEDYLHTSGPQAGLSQLALAYLKKHPKIHEVGKEAHDLLNTKLESPQDIIAYGMTYHPGSMTSLILRRGINPAPGSRVLILGAGTGVDGMVAAALGAREVVMIDRNPAAIASVTENAKRSQDPGKFKIIQANIFQLMENSEWKALLAEGKFDHIYMNMPISEVDVGDYRIQDANNALLTHLLTTMKALLNPYGTLEITNMNKPSLLEAVYQNGWIPVEMSGMTKSRLNGPLPFDHVHWVLMPAETLMRDESQRHQEMAKRVATWEKLDRLMRVSWHAKDLGHGFAAIGEPSDVQDWLELMRPFLGKEFEAFKKLVDQKGFTDQEELKWFQWFLQYPVNRLSFQEQLVFQTLFLIQTGIPYPTFDAFLQDSRAEALLGYRAQAREKAKAFRRNEPASYFIIRDEVLKLMASKIGSWKVLRDTLNFILKERVVFRTDIPDYISSSPIGSVGEGVLAFTNPDQDSDFQYEKFMIPPPFIYLHLPAAATLDQVNYVQLMTKLQSVSYQLKFLKRYSQTSVDSFQQLVQTGLFEIMGLIKVLMFGRELQLQPEDVQEVIGRLLMMRDVFSDQKVVFEKILGSSEQWELLRSTLNEVHIRVEDGTLRNYRTLKEFSVFGQALFKKISQYHQFFDYAEPEPLSRSEMRTEAPLFWGRHLLPGRPGGWELDFSHHTARDMQKTFIKLLGTISIFAFGVFLLGHFLGGSYLSSVLTAMIGTAIFDAGGQYFKRKKLDTEQVLSSAILFGTLNGVTTHLFYDLIREQPYLVRVLLGAGYLIGIGFFYIGTLFATHYSYPGIPKSQRNQEYDWKNTKRKWGQHIQLPSGVNLIRHTFVQLLGPSTRDLVAMASGALTAVLASYNANSTNFNSREIVAGIISRLTKFRSELRSELRHLELKPKIDDKAKALLTQLGVGRKNGKNSKGRTNLIDTWNLIERHAFNRPADKPLEKRELLALEGAPAKSAAIAHLKILASWGLIDYQLTEGWGRGRRAPIGVIRPGPKPVPAAWRRELAFLISQYKTEFDEPFLRPQVEALLNGKPVFQIPPGSATYETLVRKLEEKDPQVKVFARYVLYDYLQTFFPNVWIKASAFSSLFSKNPTQKILFLRELKYLADLGLVEIAKEDFARADLWIRAKPYPPHIIKRVKQRFYDDARNPDRRTLFVDVRHLLKTGNDNSRSAEGIAASPAEIDLLDYPADISEKVFSDRYLAFPLIVLTVQKVLREHQKAGGPWRVTFEEIKQELERTYGKRFHAATFWGFGRRYQLDWKKLRFSNTHLPENDADLVSYFRATLMRMRGSDAGRPIDLIDLAEDLEIGDVYKFQKRMIRVGFDFIKERIYSYRDSEQSAAIWGPYLRELGLDATKEEIGFAAHHENPEWEEVDFESKKRIVEAEVGWRRDWERRRIEEIRAYVREIQDEALEVFRQAWTGGDLEQIRLARDRMKALHPGHPIVAATLRMIAKGTIPADLRDRESIFAESEKDFKQKVKVHRQIVMGEIEAAQQQAEEARPNPELLVRRVNSVDRETKAREREIRQKTKAQEKLLREVAHAARILRTQKELLRRSSDAAGQAYLQDQLMVAMAENVEALQKQQDAIRALLPQNADDILSTLSRLQEKITLVHSDPNREGKWQEPTFAEHMMNLAILDTLLAFEIKDRETAEALSRVLTTFLVFLGYSKYGVGQDVIQRLRKFFQNLPSAWLVPDKNPKGLTPLGAAREKVLYLLQVNSQEMQRTLFREHPSWMREGGLRQRVLLLSHTPKTGTEELLVRFKQAYPGLLDHVLASFIARDGFAKMGITHDQLRRVCEVAFDRAILFWDPRSGEFEPNIRFKIWDALAWFVQSPQAIHFEEGNPETTLKNIQIFLDQKFLERHKIMKSKILSARARLARETVLRETVSADSAEAALAQNTANRSEVRDGAEPVALETLFENKSLSRRNKVSPGTQKRSEVRGQKQEHGSEKPYEVSLTKKPDGSWQSVTSRGRYSFCADWASSRLSSAQLGQLYDLFRSIPDLVGTTMAIQGIAGLPKGIFSEDTVVLLAGDQVAGTYVFDAEGRTVKAVAVNREYRGTGAADILLEDLVERFLDGNREVPFGSTITRQSTRTVSWKSFYGTVDEYKKELGILSVVTRSESRSSTFTTQVRQGSYLEKWEEEAILARLARLLPKGAKVLDFMSGINTYVPDSVQAVEILGIGLNAQELSRNRSLTRFMTQDLNLNPKIPAGLEEHFDAVIMTNGMAYLQNPEKLFASAAKALKNGGILFLAFNEKFLSSDEAHVKRWEKMDQAEHVQFAIEAVKAVNIFESVEHQRWPYRPAGLANTASLEASPAIDFVIAKKQAQQMTNSPIKVLDEPHKGAADRFLDEARQTALDGSVHASWRTQGVGDVRPSASVVAPARLKRGDSPLAVAQRSEVRGEDLTNQPNATHLPESEKTYLDSVELRENEIVFPWDPSKDQYVLITQMLEQLYWLMLGVLPLYEKTKLEIFSRELFLNIVRRTHGARGAMKFSQIITQDERQGIEIVAEDEGPGIANFPQTLKESIWLHEANRVRGNGLFYLSRYADEVVIETLGEKWVLRKVGDVSGPFPCQRTKGTRISSIVFEKDLAGRYVRQDVRSETRLEHGVIKTKDGKIDLKNKTARLIQPSGLSDTALLRTRLIPKTSLYQTRAAVNRAEGVGVSATMRRTDSSKIFGEEPLSSVRNPGYQPGPYTDTVSPSAGASHLTQAKNSTEINFYQEKNDFNAINIVLPKKDEIAVAKAVEGVFRVRTALAMGQEALGRMLAQWMPDAYADQPIADSPNSNQLKQRGNWGNPDYLQGKENQSQGSLKPIAQNILEKAGEAPYQVSVTLDQKPSVQDATVQLISEILVKKPLMRVQLVVPGFDPKMLQEFRIALMKQVNLERRKQGINAKGINLLVQSDAARVVDFMNQTGERTLVYDARETGKSALEGLLPAATTAGNRNRTLFVYSDVAAKQQAVALLGALNTLFERKQIPQGVQAASGILALLENFSLKDEARKALEQAA